MSNALKKVAGFLKKASISEESKVVSFYTTLKYKSNPKPPSLQTLKIENIDSEE
jgi:hypothetical protein